MERIWHRKLLHTWNVCVRCKQGQIRILPLQPINPQGDCLYSLPVDLRASQHSRNRVQDNHNRNRANFAQPAQRQEGWGGLIQQTVSIFLNKFHILRIFESDDSADEYPEDNKDLDDFKDKDNDDEFSDSDKIPLNDLLKAEGGDLLNDENDDEYDQIGIEKMDEQNEQVWDLLEYIKFTKFKYHWLRSYKLRFKL